MTKKQRRSGLSRNGTSMLLLTPIIAGLLTISATSATAAATPNITAKASFKGGLLTYSGKLTGAPAGTQVSLFDAASGLLLHAMNTDPKNAFNYSIPLDSAICGVKLKLDNGTTSYLKVSGAPSSTCKTSLSCNLSPSESSTTTGQNQSFTGTVLFSGKTAPTISFDFGNGNIARPAITPIKGGATAQSSQSFANADNYAVKFQATLGNQSCEDSAVVRVAPNVANAPKSVEPAFNTPASASAMSSDYSVIPFSDRGDVGTANLAPNQYQQTQALNALVYEKQPKKPILLSIGDTEVTYSAASNPNDPVGSDSINSTSQNLFPDGKTGANFDNSVSIAHDRPIPNGATQLIEGKNFTDIFDGVKKSGLWDRMLNRSNNGGSDMTRLTPTNAAKVTGLDEGGRATKDLMTNTQSMPGRIEPYVANDPQPFHAADDLGFLTAQMLPIVGIDDKGRKNPFPLMRVNAKVANESVATTDAAVVTSTELSCAQCHSKGERSADDNQWFTPVSINDPEARGNGNLLGSNSGSSYPAGRDNYASIHAPAIQNRFELKVVTSEPLLYQMVNPLNTNAANLRTDNQETIFQPLLVEKDGAPYLSEVTGQQMILRGDRVKAYRFSAEGKLQIQLNFKAAENSTPQAREQAALFNMALLHDYYDSFGNNNPALNGSKEFVTQFADAIEDKTKTATTTPPSCGGHHFSTTTHDVGRSSAYDARFVYSNYSRTMHAFHGRIQVYKQDVSQQQSADGNAHSKGEVIRDKRGHHIPFGGAGWDPEKKNNYKLDAPSSYDGTTDDFDPMQFPMHAMGELMLPFDLKRDANGEMLKQGLTANTNKTDMNENCSVCHAGKTEKLYHDMHYSVGLTCESCHGDMQAVGALWLRPGKNFTDHKNHNFRQFEYDQPNCGSCHFGSTAKAGRLAFAAWDKSATSLTMKPNSIDQRFSVQPTEVQIKRLTDRQGKTDGSGNYDLLCLGTGDCSDSLYNASANGEMKKVVGSPLFRKSIDTHGNVPCAACHGPAHTIWPVKDKNANANVTAKQLQGYEGTLMECNVCHSKEGNQNSFADGELASTEAIAYGKRGTLVTPANQKAFLAGPHGLHPINDENWYKHAEGAGTNTSKGKHNPLQNGGWHNDMAKKPGPEGEDQCAACHGDDHKGTRLSKTMVDRTFTNETGKPVLVKAGQTIGCGLCHSLEKSFTGVPQGKASTTDLPATPTTKPADGGDVNTAADPGASTGGGGVHNH